MPLHSSQMKKFARSTSCHARILNYENPKTNPPSERSMYGNLAINGISNMTIVIFTKSRQSQVFRRCVASLSLKSFDQRLGHRFHDGTKLEVTSGGNNVIPTQPQLHSIVIEGIGLWPNDSDLIRGSRIYLDGYPFCYNRSKFFNYSRNVNISARLAETDWLLLLNDDCFLESGAVEEAFSVSQESGASVVGGRIMSPDGRPEKASALTNPMSGWVKPEGRFQRVNYSYGPFMLVRKDVLISIPWDENLSLTEGDLDFSMRLHDAGFVQVVANQCRGIHRGGESSKSIRDQIQDIRCRFYFRRKHPEAGLALWEILFLLLRRMVGLHVPPLAGLLARFSVFRNRARSGT